MNESTTLWYKQFWPWFLIALPGTVVIASFITLGIAIRHSDEMVRDDYYKDGLAINQQIERDDVARRRNLDAILEWLPAAGEIRLTLPATITDASLTLHWMHPLKKALDREITLARRDDTGHYGGQIDPGMDGRFYLELENTATDSRDAWRLRGEISAERSVNQASATLQP